ncbi:YdeI/OmpD-associated family protein [Couchioplanes caeruleus]|uniref:YdeI/OmpD-associated family protein n=1 Tax=Couchioplanes caeruleus TaxID=56438 RepID=UPI0020BE7932|nr:YdeI/OmpD-associated family protein [Couchioplanes caeruleus]UQU66507.1 YdeI/OmpD-associated family protein [Couchioplanes caeruleus]
MRFRGELRATGGTATGFQVDDEVVAALDGGGRPKVVVTVNGCRWRGSIARMGGAYWLGVSAERRAAAGIAAGEVHDVDVELDTAVREVDVPADLAVALAAAPEAKRFFEGMSYTNKSWHVLQVTGAKTDETRARRIAKSVAMLSEGKAR